MYIPPDQTSRFCPKCGTKVETGSAYCMRCGAPQQVVPQPVPPMPQQQGAPPQQMPVARQAKIPTWVWVVGAIVVIFLAANHSTPKASIIGKWQSVSSKESGTIEFLKDSTVKIDFGALYYSGHYSFISDNRLKIVFEGIYSFNEPRTFDFSVSNNELTLKEENGKIEKYTRIYE